MEGGSAAIEVVVQNLISVLRDEYSLIRGLDGAARQLKKTLDMIQAYLNDAEKKNITESSVKLWLRELEVVAFDADNVLDKLSYQLVQKQVEKMKTPNPNPSPKSKVKLLSCFSSCKSISRQHDMAHTIKNINADFDSMIKRATDLGHQSKIQSASDVVVPTSTRTNSIMKDPIFVGRDDDVSKVVDMLTHIPRDRTISIVALVGMGGMGKTTLTRNVFNHDRLKTFGSHIWVHVSQNFYPISLYNTIHSTLASTTIDRVERVKHEEDILDEEVILKKLREALKAKTYLLVLDDVWNEDVLKWEDFINTMKGVSSTEGNGIIITTRSQKVASIVKPFQIHPVKGLSHEECWSIINRKSFDGNAEVPSRLEAIGKEIAERCQGLPLAAKVVGSVLCSSKSVQYWRSIKENWLLDGEGGETISTILKLSYDHLSSPSLKKCFAYCSIFPKGRKIMKDVLIELWMAEGFLFLQSSRRDDMESVGDMFCSVLLQNSLLQTAGEDNNRREYYVMHDLVHDLASSVLSNNTDGNTVVRYKFHDESSRISEEVSSNLRTLILGGGTSGTIFSHFKCLHNLTIYDRDYKELSISIKELIHLRNLNISDTSIANIPEWIGELHHLQTLRAEIKNLEKLPNTLKYLINLRHLCLMSETELPAEIGRLTSLQTLQYFKVGEEKGYQIEELGNLKNLKGKLKIENLERVLDKEEAMKANMLEKSNLSELLLSWDDERSLSERNDESVLEGLQPHANLEVLVIEGYKGKRIPTWFKKLDNLTEMILNRCSECEEIPTMEHLPNLKSLSLSRLKKARFINSSFNNLRTLVISRLELNCLPKELFYNNQNLSTLRIEKCRVLRELPDGLDTLNSLEELIIKKCKNLKSIGNPSDGVRKYQGILRKLKIKGCRGLVEFPHQILESFAPSMETLKLVGLRRLKNLTVLIDCLAKSSSRLEELIVKGVPNFMASGFIECWSLGRLKRLDIDVSVKWSRETSVIIGGTVEGMLQGCGNSLTWLQLKGVENWEWLPQSIQHLTSLSWLNLENIGVEELPHWLGNLSSLRTLSLDGCKKLRCLPSLAAGLTKLELLCFIDCPQLHIDPEWHNHPDLVIIDGLEIREIFDGFSF